MADSFSIPELVQLCWGHFTYLCCRWWFDGSSFSRFIFLLPAFGYTLGRKWVELRQPDVGVFGAIAMSPAERRKAEVEALGHEFVSIIRWPFRTWCAVRAQSFLRLSVR